MDHASDGDYARAFVWEVLRTGLMLINLLENMIESLPEDAYPGESPAEVAFEMLSGTIRPVAEAAGEPSVRAAIALLTDSSDRVLTDLRLGLELARRREQMAD